MIRLNTNQTGPGGPRACARIQLGLVVYEEPKGSPYRIGESISLQDIQTLAITARRSQVRLPEVKVLSGESFYTEGSRYAGSVAPPGREKGHGENKMVTEPNAFIVIQRSPEEKHNTF